MLRYWYDIDRELSLMDEMRRRMLSLLTGSGGVSPFAEVASPRANLYDEGHQLVAVLEVPGMTEQDIKVEVHGDTLTVTGERRVVPPEGYRVHRNERGSGWFSRSFGLPCRVDAEKTGARLRDGLLTVTMAKHPEAQPRQISVSAV